MVGIDPAHSIILISGQIVRGAAKKWFLYLAEIPPCLECARLSGIEGSPLVIKAKTKNTCVLTRVDK